MRKTVKILCTILALLMIASLFAACNNSGNSNNNNNSGSDSANTNTKTANYDANRKKVTEDDRIAPFDPPITLTVIGGAAGGLPEGNTKEDNIYTRYFRDKYNVSFNYLWTADSTQYAAKLATMFATKDFPDFFNVSGAEFIELASQGALYDITELHEIWASDQMMGFYDSFIEGFASAFYQGKQYTMPQLSNAGIIGGPQLVWVRQDWFAQTGLAEPKNMTDLTNLALKLMEQHAGTYGFGFRGDMSGLENVANGFGAFNKIWIDVGGKIEYGGVQPEMRETLLYLQDWYAKGIIHTEFTTHDWGKMNEDITAEKVGLCTFPGWMGWGMGSGLVEALVETQKDIDWLALMPPTKDGSMGYRQAGWPINVHTIISKDCKMPEAVIKVINQHAYENYTLMTFATEEFQLVDGWVFPVMSCNPRTDIDSIIEIMNAVETGDSSGVAPGTNTLYYNQFIEWQANPTVANIQNAAYGRYLYTKSLYNTTMPYLDADRIIVNKTKGVIPEAYANVKATLDKLEVETFTLIITGAPIEEFDTFVTTWYASGGQQATDDINAIFNPK